MNERGGAGRMLLFFGNASSSLPGTLSPQLQIYQWNKSTKNWHRHYQFC